MEAAPRHVQPERPRRREHDRQGRAADPRRRGRRGRGGRARRGARDRAPARRHDHPGGAPDGPRRPRRLRLDRAGRRPAAAAHGRGAGRAPGVRPGPRPRPRHGRRPARYGAGGYTDTPARGDAAGRHGRPRPPEAARRRARRRHRQVGLDGCLPLQHLRRRHGRRLGGIAGRQEGGHRQGGDPAGRVRADRTGRARRRRLRRARPTGSSRPRRSAASPTSRARSPGSARRPDEHLRRPRPGGEVAQGRHRDPAPHHPADRRLVQQRPVRRDPQGHEGRRDHALHGRRGRRLQPVPGAAREAGRRPLLQRRQPGLDPGHLPQGDAAGLRPADRRGGVLPDPDLDLADPARHRRRAAAAARLQRHDGQARRPDGPRHRPRRPAPRPVAVRPGAVGRLDVGLDRALGEELGRLGRVLAVLQPDRRLDVPGRGERRHRGRVRRPRRAHATCASRASTPTGRRATSTRPGWPSSGRTSRPRPSTSSQVAPGVYEAPGRDRCRAAPTPCA